MSGVKPILKVARAGYEVDTASNKNLAFSSEFNILKIFKIVHFTGSSSEQSVTHGLDYAPIFFPYYKDGSYYIPAINGYLDGGVPYAYVDTSNVYWKSSNDGYIILFIDPVDE